MVKFVVFTLSSKLMFPACAIFTEGISVSPTLPFTVIVYVAAGVVVF